MPRIVDVSEELRIPLDSVFYLTKARSPRLDPGVVVMTRIPKPMSCSIARLIHSSWLLNSYVRKKGDSSIYVSASGGKRILLLSLEDDETVAFTFGHLVGFCGRVSLKTYIALSIAAFAIERNFIQQVTGPGLLALEVSGTPIIETSSPSTFHPHRLLAWSPNTDFDFDTVYSFVDIYLNNLRVTATPRRDGIVILNADDAGHSSSRNPLWRLIRSVYVPW